MSQDREAPAGKQRNMKNPSHGSRSSVAIVGTGMAGLVSAYLLSNDPKGRFDVEIFEAQDELSLDSASVTAHSKDGKQSARVDQPMRGFDGYYGCLRAMYDYLGIHYDPHRFLFSYSRLSNLVSKENEDATEPISPYFVHSSNNHRLPPLRPGRWRLWDWVSEVVFLLFCFAYTVICCFLVPPKEGILQSKDGGRVGESLGHYLKRLYMPSYFVHNYLLPPLASMATCSLGAVLEFPATDLVSYIQRAYNTPPYLVSAGIQEVQTKLSDGLNVHFGSRVTSIIPNDDDSRQVTISCESTTSKSSQQKTFDHVITAVPPNALGAIFPILKPDMENMPTVPVETVVHTDPTPIATTPTSSDSKPQLFSSLHPSPDSQWIHMRTPSHGGVPETTHEHPFSVLSTNNPQTRIDPSKVISRTSFTRTLRTPKSRALVKRIFDEDDVSRDLRSTDREASSSSSSGTWRNGDGNVWLVGSWCWDGMVLLEGCVVSSMRVADALGVRVPWREPNESI